MNSSIPYKRKYYNMQEEHYFTVKPGGKRECNRFYKLRGIMTSKRKECGFEMVTTKYNVAGLGGSEGDKTESIEPKDAKQQ